MSYAKGAHSYHIAAHSMIVISVHVGMFRGRSDILTYMQDRDNNKIIFPILFVVYCKNKLLAKQMRIRNVLFVFVFLS